MATNGLSTSAKANKPSEEQGSTNTNTTKSATTTPFKDEGLRAAAEILDLDGDANPEDIDNIFIPEVEPIEDPKVESPKPVEPGSLRSRLGIEGEVVKNLPKP